jgi:hypothetical protein
MAKDYGYTDKMTAMEKAGINFYQILQKFENLRTDRDKMQKDEVQKIIDQETINRQKANIDSMISELSKISDIEYLEEKKKEFNKYIQDEKIDRNLELKDIIEEFETEVEKKMIELNV